MINLINKLLQSNCKCKDKQLQVTRKFRNMLNKYTMAHVKVAKIHNAKKDFSSDDIQNIMNLYAQDRTKLYTALTRLEKNIRNNKL
jgi:hypothetical protein